MEYPRNTALHRRLPGFVLLIQIMACITPGIPARLLDEENSGPDLMTATCRRTDNFDICMSTLRSYPESGNADLKGLALFSLQACIAHAQGTIAHMKQLRGKGGADAADGDMYESRCLDDCATDYDDALDGLRNSVGELQSGDYESVNAMVSAAMTDSDTCEGGFGENPGYSSPLTDRNDYFFKLCSNSLTIVGLLS